MTNLDIAREEGFCENTAFLPAGAIIDGGARHILSCTEKTLDAYTKRRQKEARERCADKCREIAMRGIGENIKKVLQIAEAEIRAMGNEI